MDTTTAQKNSRTIERTPEKKKVLQGKKYHLAHDRRNKIPNVQNGLKRFKTTRHHPRPQKSNGSPLTAIIKMKGSNRIRSFEVSHQVDK